VARATPTKEPAELFIGSAWSWDVAYSDFPADDSWQLSYALRGPDDIDLAWGTEVTAADSGPGFEVRVPKATTDGITTPGAYRLIGRVSKSGDEFDGLVVHNEHLLLLADPTTAVNAKSFNRQMLEALETALVAGVSSSAEVLEVVINGRRTTYRERGEIEKAHAHYLLLVAIEDNPRGSLSHATEFVRG
jgi:hypothetical protein